MGVEIPWATLLLVVPFVNILNSLPISWQGLGVILLTGKSELLWLKTVKGEVTL